jgi:pimeloyl-ACP methyl ester carboxylesterase
MKLDKFYILGHQLGGCIGLELAHLIPDKVQGVLSFSMFPLKGLKVPGFEINTME